MEKSHLFCFRSRGPGDWGDTISVSGFGLEKARQLMSFGAFRNTWQVTPSFPFPVWGCLPPKKVRLTN